MHEFDLQNEIPDEATTIEIYAMMKPARSSIEVRRTPDDDQPIVMPDGMRTTMGVPDGRKRYIMPSLFAEEFKIFVAGWFRERA